MVNVKAKLDIPPGEKEVIERMTLDGTFDVASAKFTSESIQNRIDELSRRGQGQAERRVDRRCRVEPARVVPAPRRAHDAQVAQLPRERRRGAARGDYDTKREVLDFKGTLRLQARVSQTQTGWKSLVLKVFDPMLDGEGAGTVLPISITGTRNQPKFGADIKKAILH